MCSITKKQKTVDAVLDNGKVSQELDVFNQLMEKLTGRFNIMNQQKRFETSFG